MAAKRKSAFFAATEQAQKTTPTEQEEETIKQPTVQTVEHSDSEPAKQPRIKATFYLTADDIIAIDTMQTNRFRLNSKKPEKSELVSEAIQLLFKQPNS